ncbi:hypothetical protein JOC34_000646 [Virgibacillus halotolerans]|uniref:hypothetical protein n=1 Tax=Virgibacillus halotolerans TaxID=1071053 RepID=UPI00196203B5|nr:hypothetical protein [Virgibacillus halotolerans]MBM7598289.1 hypothetical protein [Virgibacillus halotolerans]
MKVFKMNDIDYVAAKTSEEAKKFYGELCDYTYEEIQEDFEGEASLQEKMNVLLSELSEDDTVRVGDIHMKHSMLWVRKSFEWFLENDSHNNEPFVICSME